MNHKTPLSRTTGLGDKTQLLSPILADRLRKPVPIIAGILVAILANHLGNGGVHEDDVGPTAIATLYREHLINPFPSTKEKTY
jgi:putative Ca2+/H+ antiporter (TMEM165/GDT1 family)